MRAYKKRSYIIVLTIIMIFVSQIALADYKDNYTEVNINHRIERSFKPEVAKINIEVWALEKELTEAYTQATNNMNEVIKVVKTFENVTYTTTSFSVGQRFIEEDKKRELYYEVSTMIKVETDNLNELGDIIQSAISKGATNLRGISYGLRFPEKAKNKVIKDGIKEIQEKAAVIRESLGKESCEIVQLDISDSYNLYNYNYVTRSDVMGAGEALPTPEISPQDVNINVNLNVKLVLK